MKRLLLSAVLLLHLASAASADCGNPGCWMCWYIRTYGVAAWNDLMAGRSREPALINIIATPTKAIGIMLAELDLQPSDILFDLGCGDGRILIEAASRYGCRGVGIEIDPSVAERARYNIRQAEFQQRIRPDSIRITTGDARRYDLRQATAVTMYLFPDLMAELTPKLRADVRIASYAHEVPGHPNRVVQLPDGQAVYVVDLRPLSYQMGPGQ